jgi:glycosyltransferase involved in cell wall biosynthesis
MLRLLLLAPEYEDTGGGISTFYQMLAPALREANVELRVIEGSAAHAAEDGSERLCAGIRIQTLERARLARWWDRFPAFAATPGLRRHLAAAWAIWEQSGYGQDCDIVEASDWGFLFLPPAVEAVRPLVVQCHGSIGQIAVNDPIRGEETQNVLARLIERAGLARADLQTLSRANADFWRAETGRDTAIIRPGWQRTKASEPGAHGDRGLVIGRVQRWKGPQTLCSALDLLGSRAPSFEWIGKDTAWDDRKGSAIAHIAQTYPGIWGAKIAYQPPVHPEEAMRRQSAALFNLVPSTWDVFNFTAVEAMASGRPTIVSTGAGASELIEDGANGYLFSAGDPQSLASVLDRLMAENPARLIDIGRAAQETVRVELNPKAIAGRRIAAYRAAIESFQLHPPSPATGWLGDICRPAEPFQTDQMAFLDHMPLRSITTHMLKRARDKAMARISWRASAR